MRIQELGDIFRVIVIVLPRIAADWFADSSRGLLNDLLLLSLLRIVFFRPIQAWSFLVTCFLVPTLKSFEKLGVIDILWIIILGSFYCDTFRRHDRASVLLFSRCFLFRLLFECITLFALRFYFTFGCIFKERSTRIIKLFCWVLFLINFFGQFFLRSFY